MQHQYNNPKHINKQYVFPLQQYFIYIYNISFLYFNIYIIYFYLSRTRFSNNSTKYYYIYHVLNNTVNNLYRTVNKPTFNIITPFV